MGLVDPNATKRVEVADGWIDVRQAMSVGDMMKVIEGKDAASLSNPTPEIIGRMLRVGVVAWSYPDPVTPENIERLDVETAVAVFAALNDSDTDEKKDVSRSTSSNGVNGLPTSITSAS